MTNVMIVASFVLVVMLLIYWIISKQEQKEKE